MFEAKRKKKEIKSQDCLHRQNKEFISLTSRNSTLQPMFKIAFYLLFRINRFSIAIVDKIVHV